MKLGIKNYKNKNLSRSYDVIVDISILNSEIMFFCKIFFFEIGSSVRSRNKHKNKREKKSSVN